MEIHPLLPTHFKVFLKPPSKDGLVACACWNTHTTWGCKRSHFLIVVFSVLAVLALVIPYSVSMAKKAMPAFLPFVSQAAGHPPMSGIFSVFMVLMCFVAIFVVPLLHVSISHRNVNNSKRIKYANICAVGLITICSIGFLVTTAFPVGYTDLPNKFEWLVTVLIEHSGGAGMILIGGPIYHFVVTAIWLWLPDTTKRMKCFKLALSVAYVLLFCITVKPMPDFIQEESGPRPFDDLQIMKSTRYELPLVFSTNYIICAFSEWLVCIFCLSTILSFYWDMERISFHVVLRHKSCFADTLEPAPSITLKTLT